MLRNEARGGFSFLEVIMAIIFLMVCLAFLYSAFSSSTRGTADSYRETIAYTIACEAIEWTAGLGYERLVDAVETPGSEISNRLGIGTFKSLESVKYDDGTQIRYPEDYAHFERMVELLPDPGNRLVLVRVTVRPREFGFIRRQGIVLERVVGADY